MLSLFSKSSGLKISCSTPFFVVMFIHQPLVNQFTTHKSKLRPQKAIGVHTSATCNNLWYDNKLQQRICGVDYWQQWHIVWHVLAYMADSTVVKSSQARELWITGWVSDILCTCIPNFFAGITARSFYIPRDGWYLRFLWTHPTNDSIEKRHGVGNSEGGGDLPLWRPELPQITFGTFMATCL